VNGAGRARPGRAGRRYHVIRYGQRGFGWSSPRGRPYPPVADLGAVLNYAGVSQAALIGCSLPGAIIIEYALAHPARVYQPGPGCGQAPETTPEDDRARPGGRNHIRGRSALGHLLPAT